MKMNYQSVFCTWVFVKKKIYSFFKKLSQGGLVCLWLVTQRFPWTIGCGSFCFLLLFLSLHRPSDSLQKESNYWSRVFDPPLNLQEPVRAYNLSKLRIRYIGDVVDDQGHIGSFPQAMATYALGIHHRFIWKKIADLLQPFPSSS